MSDSARGSLGVLLVAVALVTAVWGALRLSQQRSDAQLSGASVAATLPDFGALDGFREDAWYLPDDSLLGFVAVPAGPFTMGSDPGVDSLAFDIEWWGEGRVQGTVDLSGFYMARYEVTVAQFTAFARATGSASLDPGAFSTPPDHPVSSVSWPDALAYARWLDGALRASEALPDSLAGLIEAGWRVTLPTEAQWEKAARGDDGRIYPWGDEPRRDRAHFGASATAPVGSSPCPECAHGLTDMSGNVWEWTRSPFQPYPYTDADDRDDLTAEALWVMRGGSFGDGLQFMRAANRGGADPGARRPFIGFRVALTRE